MQNIMVGGGVVAVGKRKKMKSYAKKGKRKAYYINNGEKAFEKASSPRPPQTYSSGEKWISKEGGGPGGDQNAQYISLSFYEFPHTHKRPSCIFAQRRAFANFRLQIESFKHKETNFTLEEGHTKRDTHRHTYRQWSQKYWNNARRILLFREKFMKMCIKGVPTVSSVPGQGAQDVPVTLRVPPGNPCNLRAYLELGG